MCHHVIEIKEDWNKRLDIDNLIYLTDSNHAIVHAAYRKSSRSKAEMQKLLFVLLDRYKKEFGIES